MELNTHVSQDRFFWMKSDLGSKDRAAVIIDVEAPAVADRTEASPTNLVVVLDRSGSMSGGRLAHARKALCDIVDRLSSRDTFGLVTFDDQVEVNVPAGPVNDRDAIKRVINGIHSRGSTDLAGGLVRGLKEARRLESLSGVRVLLVSDGHANVGVTDADVVGQLAARHLEHRITTSTLGMGLGYDEILLSAIARQGAGNEHFAEEADTAAGVIAQECGELLSQRFLSCRLTVTPANGVTGMRVLNEATMRKIADGVQIEMGGFQPEQLRSLLLQFSPKQATRPGRRKMATLRLDYVLADDLSDHSVTPHGVGAGGRGDRRPAGRQPRRDRRARLPAGPASQARRHGGAQPLRRRDGRAQLQGRDPHPQEGSAERPAQPSRRVQGRHRIHRADAPPRSRRRCGARRIALFASKAMSAQITGSFALPRSEGRMSTAFRVIPGDPRSSVIIHVPHSSRVIPDDVRAGILLDDLALERELNAMTDAYTDVIAEDARRPGAAAPVAVRQRAFAVGRRSRAVPRRP